MAGPGKGASKRFGVQNSSSNYDVRQPHKSSSDVPQPHQSNSNVPQPHQSSHLHYAPQPQKSSGRNLHSLVPMNDLHSLVGQFVNCLIEARDELKHKSEVIHRKFTITKALLFKAGRSSFDRYRQQIYKLELEQKRIEEDAFVYNWLQQQLKLSPAYKKMLEIGAYMDSKPKSDEATEDTDFDVSDISFEELLAQEKKDSFWQEKGKPRSGSD